MDSNVQVKPSVMYYEESGNTHIVGNSQISALLRLRKFGLEQAFLYQVIDLENPIHRAIDQGVGISYIGRCASRDMALWGAKKVADIVDPSKVDHTQRKTIFDGYDEVETWTSDANGDKRTNQGFRARHREYDEPVYVSRNDQIFDIAQDIQQLQPGWFYVNDNGMSRKVYLPMLSPISPFGAQAEMEILDEWLQHHYETSPHYVSPNTVKPDDLPMDNAESISSVGAEPTPAQPIRRTATDFFVHGKPLNAN